MINLPYLTTCTTAQIVKPLFYNRPETGNIIFSDGSKLYPDIIKPPFISSNVLSTNDSKTIVTSDNKQIQLNI